MQYYRDFYDPNHWTISNVEGTRCTCLAKFLLPKAIIDEHYPNAPKKLRLNNLIVVRQAVKVVRGKECQFVWVQHQLPSGEPVLLHANLKWIVFPKLIFHPDNPLFNMQA